MKIKILLIIIIPILILGCKGEYKFPMTCKTYKICENNLYITIVRQETCKHKFYFHKTLKNPFTDYVVFDRCPMDMPSISFSYKPSDPDIIYVLYNPSYVYNEPQYTTMVDSIVTLNYNIVTSPIIDLNYERKIQNKQDSKVLLEEVEYWDRKRKWEDSIVNRPSSIYIEPYGNFKGIRYWINGEYKGEAKLVR